MADNVLIDEGTGGSTGVPVAADEITGVKHQRVKVEFGVDGSATDVSSSNPLPVVNASLPLPSGASTSAKQDTTNASLSSIDGKVPALGQALAAASVPVVLTAAQVTTLTPPAAITGYATSAKQDTGNTSLSSIDGKITAVNTGAVVISSGSCAVTNAGTFAVQSASTIADGASSTLGAKADAKSTATDTTAVSAMSVLKQISASVQAPPSQAVTNAGTFATQSTFGGTRTYKTYSGTFSADTDVIAAVTSKKIKVFAYSIITTDNTGDTVIFKSNGTAGTEKWRVYLKGVDANTPMGANMSVTPGIDGAHLFATAAGEKLTADVSSAATLHLSIAYWDDDAS